MNCQHAPGILRGRLDRRTGRHDRSGAHEQRHALSRCLRNNRLAAGQALPVAGIHPLRSRWEVNLAIAGLELRDGRDKQRGTEQVLVVDFPTRPVGLEVHYQRAHYRAVVEMRAGRYGVDIGHQRVTQAMVIGEAFHHRRIAGSDDRRLALRKFAMAAKQRTERTELKPPGVEFAPFGQVIGILLAKPVFQRKTADIVRPVGHTCQAEIEPGADLVTQIVPARCHIARPERRAGALYTAEATPRQNKRTGVRLGHTQSFGHAFCMG